MNADTMQKNIDNLRRVTALCDRAGTADRDAADENVLVYMAQVIGDLAELTLPPTFVVKEAGGELHVIPGPIFEEPVSAVEGVAIATIHAALKECVNTNGLVSTDHWARAIYHALVAQRLL